MGPKATSERGNNRRLRRISVAAVGLSLLASSLASAATGGSLPALDDPFRFFPVDARARVHETQAEVAATRAAMVSPSYVTRLRGLIGIGDKEVPATPLLPAPSLEQRRQVSALPVALQEPVAGLFAAVVEAKETVGRVPYGKAARLLAQTLRLQKRSIVHPGPLRLPRRFTVRSLARFQRRSARLARARSAAPAVPRTPRFVRRLSARTERAALLIASALDHYVPQLERVDLPHTSDRAVDGCDMLDQTPLLCLGSDAKNTYVDNEVLLIDMGGDDLYRNSAGATFTIDTKALITTSVNVDLSGNDVYDADPKVANGYSVTTGLESPTEFGAAAQGAGLYGVGILVDRSSGSDSYKVSPAQTTIEVPTTRVNGQGAAANGGVGLLVDEGGKDSYRATGLSGQQNYIDTRAQAIASLGSEAALIDAGLDDDAYVLDGGSIEQTVDKPTAMSYRIASGQVHSVQDSRVVLHDEGGKDRFEAFARSTYSPTIDDYWRVTPTNVQISAQGVGVAISETYGFLLTGTDETDYSMRVDQEGPAWSWLAGQARTFIAGEGAAVLDDNGGDDVYSVRSDTRFARRFVQTDACLCDAAEAVVDTLWPAFYNILDAQGASGSLGAVTTLLHDASGNDRYESLADLDLSFTLEDRLSDPDYPALLRVWGIAPTPVTAQGNVAFGTAIMDEAGTDSYEVVNRQGVTSTIKSPRSHGKPDLRSYAVLNSDPWAQNGIVDTGGDGDTIRAASVLENRAWPDESASIDFGQGLWPKVQGGIYASGDDPVITHSTSVPACGDPGYHGFGQWGPCESNPEDPDHDVVAGGAGPGYAPLATGTRPELELLPGIPDEAPTDAHELTFLPVSARITDDKSKPMARVPLHFDVMSGGVTVSTTGQETPPSRWISFYQERALTNKKGVAKARLPLLLTTTTGDDLIPDPKTRYRIEATYDGSDDYYPRHVVKDITLLPPGPGSRSFKRPL